MGVGFVLALWFLDQGARSRRGHAAAESEDSPENCSSRREEALIALRSQPLVLEQSLLTSAATYVPSLTQVRPWPTYCAERAVSIRRNKHDDYENCHTYTSSRTNCSA